ncbi:MAG: 50S ribosomal protein L19e [Nanoarchaeota archaeon]
MKLQKRLAASLSGVGKKRVRLDLDKLDEIGGSVDDLNQSITKNDIRSYIHSGVIVIKAKRGTSRGRIRFNKGQKRKGRRKGPGSRKGRSTARQPSKPVWIAKVRLQRAFLKELREQKKVTTTQYHDLYRKSKGGFFRSKRHIKLYLEEREMHG